MDVPNDLCALLGLQKGSLRLRPHTITWKPHVYLRRVQIEENEISDTSRALRKQRVFFSLFAAKKIDVRPGKEILIALEAPLGSEDQALVFEGLLPSSDERSDEEDAEKTEVAEEEAIEAPVEPEMTNMPPKMRKTWTRQPLSEEQLNCES
jgi:hypothetical protein